MQNKTLYTDNQKKSLKMVSIFIFGGLIAISIIWSLINQEWSGFKGRTFWDWIDLLLVPILLVLLVPTANWLIRKAQKRQAEIE